MDVRDAMRANADNWFTYHPPVGDQATRYTDIRKAAGDLAAVLIAKGQPSWELNKALEQLRDVVFWANASIACNPSDEQRAEGDRLRNLAQLEKDKATFSPGAPGAPNPGASSPAASSSSPSSSPSTPTPPASSPKP